MDDTQPRYRQPGLSSPPRVPYHGHPSGGSFTGQCALQHPANSQDCKHPSIFYSSTMPESSYAVPHGLPRSTCSVSSPEYIPQRSAFSENNPHSYNYSPYASQHEMQPYSGQLMTSHGRPDSVDSYQRSSMYVHSRGTSAGDNPDTVSHFIPRPLPGGHPLLPAYVFVPPSAQRHKRPRRSYGEVERLYKCGWNGCDKAYGTLNHLNAHVTMQSHGTKRTPEEFWVIRKEWKAKKKKEEELQRKAEEERRRQEEAARFGQAPYDQQQKMPPYISGSPRLPSIGYEAIASSASRSYAPPQQVESAHLYSGHGHPPEPYGQYQQP